MSDVAITEDPIRAEDFLADIPSSSDGAMVLFLGVVRDHHDGRQVKGLVYEAYREMAVEMLETIAREVEERFGTDRITALHRIGALAVGDVATAIAVATPHRDEAYQASRYFIEALKERLPIWKREEYVEGEARWLEGRIPPTAKGKAGGGDRDVADGGTSGEGRERAPGKGRKGPGSSAFSGDERGGR